MADTDDDAPSFLEKQRAARPWLDHLVRAAGRFQEQKGDYYAAGITYFSVLALIPIMMVAFAVAGFVLAGHPSTWSRFRSRSPRAFRAAWVTPSTR